MHHKITDRQVYSYLSQTIDHDEIIAKLIENSMYLSFASTFLLSEEERRVYALFLLKNKYMQNLCLGEIKKISRECSKEGNPCVFFKGLVLGMMLYEKQYFRESGDIDVWVSEEDFEKTVSILEELGYSYHYEDRSANDEHHVVFDNGKVIVELHRFFFHPILGLDESYLVHNTCPSYLDGISCWVLSKTAMFLHLLYHLYMDYCWTFNNTYEVVVMQQTKPVNRFLYRAYEIAAFSEMFMDEIIWTDVLENISGQQLRIRFILMIEDIAKLFPSFIPDDVHNMILTKQYIDDPDDLLHRFIAEQYKTGESVDLPSAISRYVGEEWKKHGNVCKAVNRWSRFSLFDGHVDVVISKVADPADPCKLVMTITVHDSELKASEANSFDFNSSDGIHLILCGSQPYIYNSIFLFPKIQENGRYYVVPYDCIEYKELDTKQFPILELKKGSNSYTIKVGFSHAFVRNNLGNGKFFFGLIKAKYDDNTGTRSVDELISASDESQWFNPSYFHFINC